MPLCLPDKDRRILISADASDIAVGGVVWLECTPHSPEGTPLNERKVEPLAFYSKLLTELGHDPKGIVRHSPDSNRIPTVVIPYQQGTNDLHRS
ncbi:hypothetical protein GEMRC1_001219 [Eukaryota sp. GEM-RC1]